ncbi:CBS domain-containing protein [bacterium]|nr:CBS domain-containing protein [bacterium]
MVVKDLCAKDLMTSPVVTVKHNMSIEQVSNLFSNDMISGAPVLDDNGQPVGVVSLSDIARNEPRRELIISDKVAADYVIASGLFEDEELARGYHLEESETLLVRDVMTPFVYRVEEDTPMKELAEIMVSGRIHRLFVTKDGEILGVVSALDLLKTMIPGE